VTRFLVHIGPHKTGTTYIQVILDRLRDRLWEHGILVPSVWNAAPGQPSHMQLVWALRNRDLTLVRNQIRDMLALRPRYVVISCEGLSRLDPEQISQFRQLLGLAPAQVVYHVRRWSERLPSLWQETVKFGHTETFPEFLVEQLTQYDRSELRDAFMIDRFCAVFGAAQVRLVSYSHMMEEGVDIGAHFLAAFLGLSDIAMPDASQPNRSLPILDTELIRALNTIHVRHGGDKSPALRNWFLAHKEALVPEALLDTMRSGLGTLHLDDARQPFAMALQDLLVRYAASIVPPYHADGLHALRAVDVPFVGQDYLMEPSATKTLSDIYEVYRRG
jgi:hypothetical protein